MTKRQFQVKTPQHSSPKVRVAWAMNELQVLASARASTDGVITLGKVVSNGKGGANAGLHLRRGWSTGLSLYIAAGNPMAATVLVRVMPASKLQSVLLSVVFVACSVVGLSLGCGFGGSSAILMAFPGLIVGVFTAILLTVVVQRSGLGISKESSVLANTLSADVARWVEQRTAVD